MYNTSKVLAGRDRQPKVSDIVKSIPSDDIWKCYIGDFRVGKVYNSPLREDKTPSFGLFRSHSDGALLYKDLATGASGNIFSFIKEYKKLSTMKEVYDDILSNLNKGSISISDNKDVYKKSRGINISVKRKHFESHDILLWKQFNIDLDILKKFKVNAITNYIVDNKILATYSDDNPMYSYKVFDKFKIYRPLAPKTNKWRGNLSNLDIQGFEQLPKNGGLLFITKSLKDVMTLDSLGYAAIAPASETSIIPDVVIKNVKSRFKRIIIFYDRDMTGMTFTRKIVNKYRFEFAFINKKYKCKDISDFVKKYGVEDTKKLLLKITKGQL
jgi:hypothetical protein